MAWGSDKPLPASPCKWGWGTMGRIYAKIGAAGTTIPKQAHGEFRIDGWKVVVKRGTSGGIGKPRVFVESGGRLVPAGRVRQALCRVAVHRAQRKAARLRGPKGRFGPFKR